MNPETQLCRRLLPFLLVWIAAIVIMLSSCTTTEPPAPTFKEWEWAECLPSAAGYDCPGDKPSWELYQKSGAIVWRYYVEGRSLYTDEYGQVWRIYQNVYCLNSEGERVGTHHNMGFRGFQFRPDPVTGELPNADDWGVTEGVLCIFGVIKDGRVLPLVW